MDMTNKQFQGFIRLSLALIDEAVSKSPYKKDLLKLKRYFSKYVRGWQLITIQLQARSFEMIKTLLLFILKDVCQWEGQRCFHVSDSDRFIKMRFTY